MTLDSNGAVNMVDCEVPAGTLFMRANGLTVAANNAIFSSTTTISFANNGVSTINLVDCTFKDYLAISAKANSGSSITVTGAKVDLLTTTSLFYLTFATFEPGVTFTVSDSVLTVSATSDTKIFIPPSTGGSIFKVHNNTFNFVSTNSNAPAFIFAGFIGEPDGATSTFEVTNNTIVCDMDSDVASCGVIYAQNTFGPSSVTIQNNIITSPQGKLATVKLFDADAQPNGKLELLIDGNTVDIAANFYNKISVTADHDVTISNNKFTSASSVILLQITAAPLSTSNFTFNDNIVLFNVAATDGQNSAAMLFWITAGYPSPITASYAITDSSFTNVNAAPSTTLFRFFGVAPQVSSMYDIPIILRGIEFNGQLVDAYNINTFAAGNTNGKGYEFVLDPTTTAEEETATEEDTTTADEDVTSTDDDASEGEATSEFETSTTTTTTTTATTEETTTTTTTTTTTRVPDTEAPNVPLPVVTFTTRLAFKRHDFGNSAAAPSAAASAATAFFSAIAAAFLLGIVA